MMGNNEGRLTEVEIQKEANTRIQITRAETAPMLQKGWKVLKIGWICPVVPILGAIAMFACVAYAFWTGIAVNAKGNSDGTKLMLSAPLLSAPIAIFWMLLYFHFMFGH